MVLLHQGPAAAKAPRGAQEAASNSAHLPIGSSSPRARPQYYHPQARAVKADLTEWRASARGAARAAMHRVNMAQSSKAAAPTGSATHGTASVRAPVPPAWPSPRQGPPTSLPRTPRQSARLSPRIVPLSERTNFGQARACDFFGQSRAIVASEKGKGLLALLNSRLPPTSNQALRWPPIGDVRWGPSVYPPWTLPPAGRSSGLTPPRREEGEQLHARPWPAPTRSMGRSESATKEDELPHLRVPPGTTAIPTGAPYVEPPPPTTASGASGSDQPPQRDEQLVRLWLQRERQHLREVEAVRIEAGLAHGAEQFAGWCEELFGESALSSLTSSK
jgi:hypothetical protein